MAEHKRSLTWRDPAAVVAVAVAVVVWVALLGYHPGDSAWSYVASVPIIRNQEGVFGAWVADILLATLGWVAWVLPALLLVWVSRAFLSEHRQVAVGWHLRAQRLAGHSILILSAAALFSVASASGAELPAGPGGWVGDLIGWYFLIALGVSGSMTVLIAYVVIGLMLITQMPPLAMLLALGGYCQRFYSALVVFYGRARQLLVRSGERRGERGKRERTVKRAARPVVHAQPPKAPEPKAQEPAKADATSIKVPDILQARTALTTDLLIKDDGSGVVDIDEKALEANSQLVESRLQDFGIQARVVAVHPGPVITRYELQLAAGTKVSKVSALDKDLARSLSVVSVRVVEVIAGKSVIGLELPNPNRAMVRFRTVLEAPAYRHATAALPLALGEDIQGQPVVADLAKMPHLLVAGTTGSGKSVGVNGMILSLLFRLSPDELRFIMVDPKMLELSVYNGIGHLLTPVVTDMTEAASALKWCVNEMERRYRLMAALGVRQLAAYNEKVEQAEKAGEPIADPFHVYTDENPVAYCKKMPAIVVVIDEFADMIMVVGKKVEQLIARIAQKARAAGIHLVLATQRPSVDVITGLIKANVPARISFQVSSRIDSRTVLDQQGAEQLLGHGDMLYLKPGTGVPVRVHGAFVADEEVHRVVSAIKSIYPEPDYDEQICSERGEAEESGAGGGERSCEDPLYDEAVAQVRKSQRVSVSSVQRRFRIGYNRAANLVEAMEEAGVVSEMNSSGGRDVLLPSEE